MAIRIRSMNLNQMSVHTLTAVYSLHWVVAVMIPNLLRSARFHKVFPCILLVVTFWPRALSIGQTFAVKMSERDTQFPNTLKEFGYTFNAEGQLRKLDENTGAATDEPYQFDVSKNPTFNQQRYEALGEIITEHVYQLLIDLGLHKINVETTVGTPSNFVFASKPNLSQSKKLLILIHGSGVVRAGQWSRSLIINHSLDHGTQIPYIKRAITLGYDVLVTNTNLYLKNSASPTLHARLVWKQILNSMQNVESFAIVAHSYGGIVTIDLAKEYADVFLSKCFAIGFTDSVHSSRGLSAELLKRFQQIACNWVTSSEPLDTPLKSSANDVPHRSAGHTKHEWTSWACIDALFTFFEGNYKQLRSNDEF